MRNIILACACPLLLLLTISVHAQHALPLEHQLRLAHYELSWEMPEEIAYKFIRYPSKTYQNFDFSLQTRKPQLQVRYLLVPAEQDEDKNLIPHLRAGAMAMHLASNEEDSYVAAHQLDPALVDSVYQADWAQTFFFKPKDAFSLAEHCQMTAIYREGVALAYVFLLFEEVPKNIATYTESLRFLPRRLPD